MTHSGPRAHPAALTIAPSLEPVLRDIEFPTPDPVRPGRTLLIVTLACGLGIVAGPVAMALKHLIFLVTNLSYFGLFSAHPADPAAHGLGTIAIVLPVLGGLIVGIMARFGSAAIRGHGIPEAMEQVLTNDSRIPARLIWLKPLSAAISIGTGGPFGAEGPIIATGGALGSAWGQWLHTSPGERKTLLAAGAAAGMSATFGSPVSAVLLAIELLLFEFRARSFIPVALAAALAAGMRGLFEGAGAAFPTAGLDVPPLQSLPMYAILGLICGLAAVLVTRLVYGIEDAFDRLPFHWMWWPAIGGVIVGVVGLLSPRTLGVGYENISAITSGEMALGAALLLCSLKLVSWSVALGSGTSGGTLAPLFTVGAGLGLAVGTAMDSVIPAAGVDPRMAALVGMAAIFAGASRATFASAVFAFETTWQIPALTPLLIGCALATLLARLIAPESIMTEKMARRGVRSPTDYKPDPLEHMLVSQLASTDVVHLQADRTVGDVSRWLLTGGERTDHHSYPVLNSDGALVGVVARHPIQLAAQRDPESPLSDLIALPPVAVYEDCTVHQALGHMHRHKVGRLPVLSRTSPARLTGIITRSDILSAYSGKIEATGRDTAARA